MDKINKWGFSNKDNCDDMETDKEKIKICEKWLQKNAIKRNAISKIACSYRLKHLVERDNEYIANGELIVAAINLGYRYRIVGKNACFNMTILCES